MSLYGPTFHGTPFDLRIIFQYKIYISVLCLVEINLLEINLLSIEAGRVIIISGNPKVTSHAKLLHALKQPPRRRYMHYYPAEILF